MSATLNIVSKYDGRGIRKARKDLLGLNKFASQQLHRFQIGALTASAIAMAKISADAYIADEKAANQLAVQMRNIGLGYATAANEKWIAAMQKSTGILDDELRPAMVKFIAVTKDVNVSQLLMQKAVDISAGTGKDLDTVVTALSRALAGNRRGLMALGTGIDATELKAGKLSDIFDKLSKYDGSNIAQIGTKARELADAQIIIADATEKVGYYVTMGVSNFIKGVGAIAGWVQQMDSHLQGKKMPDGYTGRYAFSKKTESATTKAETDRENRRAKAQSKTIAGTHKAKTALDTYLAGVDATAKATDKNTKATDKNTKAKARNAALTRLSAKYDLQLIGLAAAKKRNTGNAGVMGRLSDLTTLAQASAGLPVSASALAGAKNTQVPNVVVNVHGSVVTQHELTQMIKDSIAGGNKYGFGTWGGGL